MKTNIPQENEEMFFTVYNDAGEAVECEILFTFEDPLTGKNYLVFTDNLQDEDGSTKVYTNQFNPENSEASLLPIEDERIWKIIEETLVQLQEEYAEDDLSAEDPETELRKTIEELSTTMPHLKDTFEALLSDPQIEDDSGE